MAERLDCFKKVDQIEGPGKYILATDPADRSSNTLMSDSTRLIDNILGRMPNLVWEIQSALSDKHPEIKYLDFNTGLPGDKSLKEGVLMDWVMQSGFIVSKGQWYRILETGGIRINDSHLILQDSGRPERAGIFTPPTVDKNGVIELDLNGSEDINQGQRGTYWRGRLSVEGDKRGPLVEESIKIINAEITRLKIPFWRDLRTGSIPQNLL
jgi:hypothetical protein